MQVLRFLCFSVYFTTNIHETKGKQNIIAWAASWHTNKITVRTAKTQISLGIRPVWSESSLTAWIKLGFLATP